MALEEKELSGVDFLIVFNKKLKGKWSWRIRSSWEQILYCFQLGNIRKSKENGPGGKWALRSRVPYCFQQEIERKMVLEDPELPGEDFLIVLTKKLQGKWTWNSVREYKEK